MSASSQNLLVRIVSAAILGTVVIASAVTSKYLFALLCLITVGICVAEWANMAWSRKLTLVIGFIYIVTTAASIPVLRYVGGWQPTLFLLVSVWATDIGSFTAGKFLGGEKLMPAISPNKTWSGAIGGFYAGAIAGRLGAHLIGLVPFEALAAGAMLSLVTQLGDLVESAAKRRFGVKDSGWIMPGHGGILDRVDGLLLAGFCYSIWYFLISGAHHDF